MNYIGITKSEIKELTEALLMSFFKEISTKGMSCIDIDGFASYLGLTVKYENIAEPNKDKLAFYSNGSKPLLVYRNHTPVMILFPAKTIVIDNYLRQIDMSSKRRYTLAHEIGHYVLEMYGYAPTGSRYFNDYSTESHYDMNELKQVFNINEIQANEIGAFLLMPEFMIQDALNKYFDSGKVDIYGESLLPANTKVKIRAIAKELGVSFSALIIQIKKLGLISRHPVENFCEVVMQ